MELKYKYILNREEWWNRVSATADLENEVKAAKPRMEMTYHNTHAYFCLAFYTLEHSDIHVRYTKTISLILIATID